MLPKNDLASLLPDREAENKCVFVRGNTTTIKNSERSEGGSVRSHTLEAHKSLQRKRNVKKVSFFRGNENEFFLLFFYSRRTAQQATGSERSLISLPLSSGESVVAFLPFFSLPQLSPSLSTFIFLLFSVGTEAALKGWREREEGELQLGGEGEEGGKWNFLYVATFSMMGEKEKGKREEARLKNANWSDFSFHPKSSATLERIFLTLWATEAADT